ncbi:hypothetical protein SAMN05192551_10520 [Tindallia magadiensis]|uniref:DUF192 domain-containing protein n=1 Tax=Tindallia magadiensis TaxID=69895 RepID=A0A1I3EIL1_9FIRM|nr:DUF192 domain-containing protein [Tindallia magadiensis]SFH98777.1 hypothetical protein SAMN05192551_10520 [Tindallia magadiensis]
MVVKEAKSFFQRFIGLMGKKEMNSEGLLFRNCAAVHTCFMKFTICIVFLDENDKVLDYQTLPPWKVSKIVEGTKHILETQWQEEKAKEIVGQVIQMEVC